MFNRRLLHYALDHRLSLAATVLLGFAGGILIVLQARLLSGVISQVFLQGAALSDVTRLLAGLLLMILLRSGLTWAAETSANYTAVHIKFELRQQLFAHIQRLGPQYVRGERTGELTNTCVEGIEALDAYFREYVPQIALAALVPLTILALVFPLDWVSAVILLVTAPLIPVFMALIGSLAESLTQRQWQTLSRMSAYFLDVLQGLTTLKMFGRSRAQINVIARISDQFRSRTMQVLRVAFLSALVLELLSTLSIALIAVGIGVRLLYGQLAFSEAFFILVVAPDFYLPLRLLGSRFHAGMAGVSAAERIFAILDLPAGPAAAEPAPMPGRPITASGPPDVRLQSVTFTYPGEDTPALKSIDLHLPAGARVALVGPSGSGKSTLAGLILGLLQPDSGSILFDGQSVENPHSPAWPAAAWVPQAPYLFNDSAAANLRLAHPAASQPELQQAVRLARADTFLEQLPQGYETNLGERGARLSGGQAQRLALARAFLRDAPVLVLDEATANLDPALESEVQAAFEQLQRDRSVLLIAHRLPTVRSADRIYVLEDGRIIQSGTHEELLSAPGLYRQMVSAYSPDELPPAASPGGEEERLPEFAAALPAEAVPSQSVAGQFSATRLVGLLASFLRPHLGWVLLSVLLGFATIASGIGLMSTSAFIIATAALQPSIAAIQLAVVGVRFFGLSRGLFRYLERLVSHQTTFHVLARLRVWFYTNLEPLAPARLLQYRSGDLLSRIVDDINILENFYIRGLAPPAVAALVALLMVVFMAGFHPSLALILLFFLVLAGAVLPLAGGALSRGPAGARVRVRASMNEHIVDGIQGLPDLLVYRQAGSYARGLAALERQFMQAQTSYARLQSLQNSLMLLLSNLAMWVILLAAIPLVRAGVFDGVSLAVIVLASLACFEAVQGLPQATSTLEASLQAASRLLELVSTEPEVPEREIPKSHAPAEVQASDRTLRPAAPPSLQAVNLNFTYPGAGQPALVGIDFELPAGGKLALVGPSGGGKSTLVALLLRFWDLPDGALYLDGRDIRRYAPASAREAMAVVSQGTYIFNTSLRENLLIARPGAGEAELLAACRLAQLEDLLESLPHGLDTYLGDQGQRLSGGERQRLAIARALLKDSPLLILDEATASLDALTEQAVWQALQPVIAQRTTLVITHRLVGLEAMDEILVIKEGRIAERGSHSQLLLAGGIYYRMQRLQNQILPDI